MRTKWFRIEELVDPDLFRSYSQRQHYLWGLLDDRTLITIDRMRDRYGTCIINNWLWGGNYTLSGLRGADVTIGAKLSQHKFGRAYDLKFGSIEPEEIRQDIKEHPHRDTYEFIRCVEDGTPTWLHLDTRNHDQGGILWIPT